MGIRQDLPPLPPKQKPTLFNLDGAVGLYVGYFLGIGAALVAGVIGAPLVALPFVAYGVQALSGVVGASRGMQRMEQESVHGRLVREPRILNKGTVLGIVGFSALSLVLGAVLPATIVASGAYGLTMVAGSLISMVAGSVWRLNEMKQDVAQAEQLKAQYMSGGRAPMRSPYMDSVSHAEAQQLEGRLNHSGGQQSFAERADQSRTHGQQQLS